MTPKEYCEQAILTEAPQTEDKVQNLLNSFRLLHGVIGIATESGELLDQIKRHIYYGRPLDFPNVKEEIGDILWYIAQLCDSCSFDLEEIMKLNIQKLRLRYPNRFTDYDALNRNLETERKTIEGKGCLTPPDPRS